MMSNISSLVNVDWFLGLFSIDGRHHAETRPVLILILKAFRLMIAPTGIWTLCRGVKKFSVTESSAFRPEMNPISISAMVVEMR